MTVLEQNTWTVLEKSDRAEDQDYNPRTLLERGVLVKKEKYKRGSREQTREHQACWLSKCSAYQAELIWLSKVSSS